MRLLTYDVKLYFGMMLEYTGSLKYVKFGVVALKLSTNTIIVVLPSSSLPGVLHVINPLQDDKT